MRPRNSSWIAQQRAVFLIFREAEEEAVRAPRIAGDRRDHLRMQPLIERTLLADRRRVFLPYGRAVIGRGHVDALHRGIAPGVLGEQLVPDVEPGRDVPDALQEWQQAVFFRQIRHQVRRGAQAQDRVSLLVSAIDPSRMLTRHGTDEWRSAAVTTSALADRTPSRATIDKRSVARLVAWDGVGRQIRSCVAHRISSRFARALYSPKRRCQSRRTAGAPGQISKATGPRFAMRSPGGLRTNNGTVQPR